MSGMSPKDMFLALLDSYFCDVSREEGLKDLASVAARDDKYNSEVTAAIDAGIAAAGDGDRAVLDFVRDQFLRFRRDDDAVREFLDEFRSDYLLYLDLYRSG
jgi:hypothetical protein